MPAVSTLPDDVVRFIQEQIHSVQQLEMLLWLRENQRAWTAAAVAAELRITEQSAEIRLRDLVLRELVVEDGGTRTFRYSPRTEELARLVGALGECYSRARYSVINLIFSSPGDSARSLADAFRFRKKKED